jgi:hypothetical protein
MPSIFSKYLVFFLSDRRQETQAEFGKQQQQQFPAEGSNQTPVKDMEKYSFV